MSSRLEVLSARRQALQSEIALQRTDMALAYGAIEQGAGRVDRTVATVRRLAPLLVVVGAAGLLALGPGRAVSLLRRGLTLALYASQARRLLG